MGLLRILFQVVVLMLHMRRQILFIMRTTSLRRRRTLYHVIKVFVMV